MRILTGHDEALEDFGFAADELLEGCLVIPVELFVTRTKASNVCFTASGSIDVR